MPTLKGGWVGSGTRRARIECTYTETDSSGKASVDADFYFATEYSVWDSTNSYSISGDLGSTSGTNLDINHGSSGGRTKIGNLTKTVSKNADVSASVSGINYIGQTVSATFTIKIDTKVLKPVVSEISAKASSGTSLSARVTEYEANGSITSTEVEYGTSKTSTKKKSASGLATIEVTGLTTGSKYYVRMRIKNSSGWSSYSDWVTATTTASKPATPKDSWSITKIEATSAVTTGCSVPDDGGSKVIAYEVQYNTSKSDNGAQSRSAASNPVMTNLSPDTSYYARVRAKNSEGWSGYTDWKAFKTTQGLYVRYGGSYKLAQAFVKWNGKWMPAKGYVKQGGVWK